MYELQSQLISVVIAKATLEQIIELVVPNVLSFVLRIINFPRQRRIRRSITRDPEERQRLVDSGAIVDDHMLFTPPRHNRYTQEDDVRAVLDEQQRLSYDDTIDDYGEIVIQFGFICLFGMAFPLASLVSLINNLIEVRTDAFKLLRIHKRPDTDVATSIGGWLIVIRGLSMLSIVTTSAILTITTPALQSALSVLFPHQAVHLTIEYRLVWFVVVEHLLFAVRWAVDFMVSETPSATHRLGARRQFLIARCFRVGQKPYFSGRPFNTSYNYRSRMYSTADSVKHF